jgi:uncharacterized protein DUF3592
MKKTELSIVQQIGLSLSVLLLLSVGLTIAGYMAGAQDREKIAGFAADAATATGTVTKKYIHSVGPGRVWVYWLDLSFVTQDGVSHASSINVANAIHDRYDVGSRVPVTYVKSRPEYFYIPGTEPTRRDLGIADGMFKYGAIASAVFVAGLIGLFFVGRGQGGAPPSPTAEQLARATGGRAPNPSRASFGTRQS